MFDRPGTGRLEWAEGVEKLLNFIENFTARYRAENIPVNQDGRIAMEAYTGLYSDVSQDLKLSQSREEQWKKEKGGIKRTETDGEKLEMLAYAIFVKNLGDQFIVARSSAHDDHKYKVDTMILDRETGNLVCAFDEVGETSGARYEQKQRTIQEYNLKGGTEVKYGLGTTQDHGGGIALSSEKNIPLFYLALPKDHIEKGIAEFLPDTKKQSDFEEKLFAYFIATLSAQIQGLELYSSRLDMHLKEKLIAFKKVVTDLDSRQKEKKKH